MQIPRVALIALIALAPVPTALAGDRVAAREPEAARSASTTVLPPAAPSRLEKSPAPPEDNNREKTLALLILILKEGRGAR
jgi:hypothetical protein